MAWAVMSTRSDGFVVTEDEWNEIANNFAVLSAHVHDGAAGQGAGTLTLADGSVGAPSLSNTGDTNTGLYFSAADTVDIATGGTNRVSITSASVLGTVPYVSSNATLPIGYSAGAGGTVTQLTSKSTGVTLNKSTGIITLHNAALAANTTVGFILTNSAITNEATTLVLNHYTGGTLGAYLLTSSTNGGTGATTIGVRNTTAGSLSEAIQISFAVIRGSYT